MSEESKTQGEGDMVLGESYSNIDFTPITNVREGRGRGMFKDL